MTAITNKIRLLFDANYRLAVMIVIAVIFHAALIFSNGFSLEKLKPEKLKPAPLTLNVTLNSPPDDAALDLLSPLTNRSQTDNNSSHDATIDILTVEKAFANLVHDGPANEIGPSPPRKRKTSELWAFIGSKLSVSPEPSDDRVIRSNASDSGYLNTWQQSVESGMLGISPVLNPEQTGRLTMMVGIKPDGKLHRVRIIRSSGDQALDDTARKMIRQASPFPPPPDTIKRNSKLLHIPRTWIFRDGKTMVDTTPLRGVE